MKTTNAMPVFFYGGLINEAMQERVGVRPTRKVRAMLNGFSLTISPWVNLKRSPDDVVYGMVMWVRHDELERLYGQLKVRYFPVAVLASTEDGSLPALCYIAEAMESGQAAEDHVHMLLEPAVRLGFPGWYLDRIRSYMPRHG